MTNGLQRLRQYLRPTGTRSEILKASLIRRKEIHRRLTLVLPYFNISLFVIGFLYLLALPSSILGRGHYVSENALQPAQVNTYWNWADVHIADQQAQLVSHLIPYSTEQRAFALKDAFLALGLPAATQSYSYSIGDSHRNGTNVYSILHAPKTDGAEALVLSASWYSRNRDKMTGERKVNERGIAIVLALANYLKKYSMWSKDIIFLISDGHTEGAQAWVDSYHNYGQTNLEAQRLSLRSGVIWAALNVDYSHHSFSHIGLFFEGANAHLPNLDYVNSASHILQNTGVPTILSSDLSLAGLRPNHFADKSLLRWLDSDMLKTYERATRNLWRQLCVSAMGKAGGPEGVFGRYRIDAITMYAVPADGPHGFHDLGRAIESTFRSLNNLLERLHASFFLYLMTSVTTFITVGNYLAAPVLISAGMTIQGLSLWGNSSPATSTTSVGKLLEGQGIVLERGPMTAEAFMVMGLSHAIGGIIFAIITHLDPMRPISTVLLHVLFGVIACFPLLVAFLLAPTSALSPRPSVPFSSTLKSINLILAGMVIAITATLNFGAATFLAILLALPLSLSSPRQSSAGQRIQQLVLIALNPIGMLFVVRRYDSEGANRILKSILEEWSIGGTSSLPLGCFVVVPLVLTASVAAAFT